MRKTPVLLLMACVLLVSFLLNGCAADDKSGDISSALAESLLESAQQQQNGQHGSPAPIEENPQPQESEALPRESDEPAQDSPVIDDLADALTGWWVCMDEGSMDPKFPIINYFDGNGKVFLSPEDYYAFALGEQTHYCKWEIADGKAVYWAIGEPDEAPVKCDITFDSDEQMSITWPDGVTSNFMKNTSQKASLFLKKGDYAYLAEAPVLCLVIYDKALDYGCHSLLMDDVVWVSCDDTDLIAEYHLENAYFDNDYELYNANEEYTPVVTMGDEGTKFFVVSWTDDGSPCGDKQIGSDEFMDKLKGQSYPMLAYLKLEEGGFVSEIREVYTP